MKPMKTLRRHHFVATAGLLALGASLNVGGAIDAVARSVGQKMSAWSISRLIELLDQPGVTVGVNKIRRNGET